MTKILTSLIILAFAFTGCSSRDNADNATVDSSATPMESEVAKTDPEIINMLMTINTEEMNLAKVGRQNAQNQKVKQYAEKMLKEHASSNDRLAKMRNSQSMGLTETGSSNRVKTKVESSVEDLKMIKGKEFDKAFMDAQITMHQKALNKIETTLAPNSANPKLKAELESTSKKVEEHLKHAQEIQSTI